MESNQQTRLEIKTSADGKPLEFVIESMENEEVVNIPGLAMRITAKEFSELAKTVNCSLERPETFSVADWQKYYDQQNKVVCDFRWKADPLEIKQHLEVIWDDILCNASDLFYMLGDICNDLGDRLYPYE